MESQIDDVFPNIFLSANIHFKNDKRQIKQTNSSNKERCGVSTTFIEWTAIFINYQTLQIRILAKGIN